MMNTQLSVGISINIGQGPMLTQTGNCGNFRGTSAHAVRQSNSCGSSSSSGGVQHRADGQDSSDFLTDFVMMLCFQRDGDKDGGASYGQDDSMLDYFADLIDQAQRTHGQAEEHSSWGDLIRHKSHLSEGELEEFRQGIKKAFSSFGGDSYSNAQGSLTGLPITSQPTYSTPAVTRATCSSVNVWGSDDGESVDADRNRQSYGHQGDGYGNQGYDDRSQNDNETGYRQGCMQDAYQRAPQLTVDISIENSPQTQTEQAGYDLGNHLATNLGSSVLDNIEMSTRGNKYLISKHQDRDTAADVGKFMDLHQDVYGTVKGGWEHRIEKGKEFSADDIAQFQQAISDVKGIMNGQSTGDRQLDSDAMLLANSVALNAMRQTATSSV